MRHHIFTTILLVAAASTLGAQPQQPPQAPALETLRVQGNIYAIFGAGGNVQLFGDPADYNNGVGQAGVRILSWREIR